MHARHDLQHIFRRLHAGTYIPMSPLHSSYVSSVPVPQRLLRHQRQSPACDPHGCSSAQSAAGLKRQRRRCYALDLKPFCTNSLLKDPLLACSTTLMARSLSISHSGALMRTLLHREFCLLSPSLRPQRDGCALVLGARFVFPGRRRHPPALPAQHCSSAELFFGPDTMRPSRSPELYPLAPMRYPPPRTSRRTSRA